MGLLFMSCAKGNEKKISSFNNTKSHMMGQDCMSCHVKGGDGEGWFTTAGTIYDTTLIATYPNVTVDLYSGVNGTGDLVESVQVDGNGNFYTTYNLDFSSGLFPTVTNNAGVKRSMSFAPTTGACNSCHGVTTDKIWVD